MTSTKRSPERKAQSHMPLHSASFEASHEIQRRHIVRATRKGESAVPERSEGATVRPLVSQLQQLRQQQAQRQCQQQAFKPLRNDFGQLNDGITMQTYNHLFEKVHDYDNLILAFRKARKRKTKKEYVQRFEANLQNELYKLQWEIATGIYKPAPLTTFTIYDPKTRKINASHFRDRVVHHAIYNVIEPIFESRFIFDTYANRKGKGTSGTLKRFDKFIRKSNGGYALKADIRHYFDTVNHKVLLSILGRRIKDEKLLSLISLILDNHKAKIRGVGMPLGNLTSQFFANVFLAELDNFVKHELRARYYLRYVDDFIILGGKAQLADWKARIDLFLSSKLKIGLHSDKTKIIPISAGVPLVGFRVFRTHKLLKKSNLRRFRNRLANMKKDLKSGAITQEHFILSMAGWNGYAGMANTFNIRQEINFGIGVEP